MKNNNKVKVSITRSKELHDYVQGLQETKLYSFSSAVNSIIFDHKKRNNGKAKSRKD